jgi:hypothetical protein
LKLTSVLLIFALIGLCRESYSADTAPPPRFPLEVAPKSTMINPPASSLFLGTVTIELDKTTLAEAVNRIKAGEIRHQGDAGESVYWVCYSNLSPTGWEQIWLLSNGEMGGDQHVITGVAAKQRPSKPSTACKQLPEALQSVRLNDGIWLGTSAKAVVKKLGKPSLKQKEWLHYQSQRELVGDTRAKDYGTANFNELGTLSVRITKDVISEIWAGKQTSE